MREKEIPLKLLSLLSSLLTKGTNFKTYIMVVVYNIEIKVVSSNVANIFVNNIFVGKETTMLHAKQSFEFNVDATNAVLTITKL